MRIEGLSATLHPNSEGVYESADSIAVSYAADGHSECFGVEDGSFWFRHRNNCIANMLRRHPFSGGPLLDIGGGNGFVAQRLQQEGHEVVLLEPGRVGAHNARVHRGLQHVVCATAESAGFRPGSFGAIGMFDVIEHIEDDREFIGTVAPLLAPQGRLYLTVPCHQWLWSRADVAAGHFRRHNQATLEAMLVDRFRIDYLSYFFQPLVLPQYLLRALPYQLGLGRDKSLLSNEAEHGSGNGLVVRIIERLLDGEARTIAVGGRIGTGASCLVAATRL